MVLNLEDHLQCSQEFSVAEGVQGDEQGSNETTGDFKPSDLLKTLFKRDEPLLRRMGC